MLVAAAVVVALHHLDAIVNVALVGVMLMAVAAAVAMTVVDKYYDASGGGGGGGGCPLEKVRTVDLVKRATESRKPQLDAWLDRPSCDLLPLSHPASQTQENYLSNHYLHYCDDNGSSFVC